jgi:hypothetical protein
VCAGASCDERGSRTFHAASTLRALERRGFVSVQLSPDGGMMARITDAGRAALAPEVKP